MQPYPRALALTDALARLSDDSRFAVLLEHGSMSVEVYAPRGTDDQTPHTQDEIYVVASGSAMLDIEGVPHALTSGDVAFVRAGEDHRFVEFTEDFSTWVVFYGPPGGEQPAGESRTASLTRKPERQATDREELYAFLDSQLVGTLASVVDGEPWVVPMLYGRDGDRILLHGSTGAGLLRHVAHGAPVALAVTALDGLVVAESTFESSANYRSVVIRGRLEQLAGVSEAEALETISERILPDRPTEVGSSSRKEVAATLALALTITDDNWIMKTRTGPPGEPESAVDVWCGVVPLTLAAGAPEPAPWAVGPVPASVVGFVAARPAP